MHPVLRAIHQSPLSPYLVQLKGVQHPAQTNACLVRYELSAPDT
jgi:hypothetical protein